MFSKRVAQAFVLVVVLAAVALGPPSEAEAQTYNWSTVTVDSAGSVGEYTSLVLGANGDAMISYHDGTPNLDLKFAICDLSATGCDQAGDWTRVTVETVGDMGRHTSIAVGSNGDPVISYYDGTNYDLKFATCDLSATGCDQTGDWGTVTVDSTGTVGEYASITVDMNGDPMISYRKG